ncbi:Superoxide dismutase [Mn/Fe] [Psilocybe cubensis]|uniref:Superoxide dismutase [Mn/Fe] n=2 Tax=Psilocybe cubensis TaxID=181762 RepID=A0ACB8H6T4_PSICU|nr:Superoxide dismutase [Mn/Fe] [Psilocybe cubensis]KAH9482885.1 Superoxide dismutase [Mn/Fe] [Psilocybe cubensis]
MASSLRLVSSRIPRSSSRFSSFQSTLGRRNVHQVRELPYPIEQGLGKFLPPAALKTLMEYQKGLLDRLNDELKTDTATEPHATVAAITINCATRRERILAFNYGALALNNSFFLEQLAPPPDEESGLKSHQGYISDELFEKIRDHYGDIIGLKSTFCASALGMFSSGWVWMVTDGEGNLGVLPTLGPSTLLVRSRTNMHYLSKENNQAIGANIIIKDSQNTTPRPIPSLPGAGPSSPFSGMPTQPPSQGLFSDHTRAFSANSAQANDYRSGTATMYGDSPSESAVRGSNIPSALAVGNVIFPLFCVPVYEHAWMSAGFGVWGKEDWLKEFWSVLDWRKVSRAYRASRESTINVHG